MSTDLQGNDESFPELEPPIGEAIRVFTSEGPNFTSQFSQGVFSRHDGIPGYNQDALTNVDICLVGGGGLGGWIAVELLRSGTCDRLTLIEKDWYEESNANRQLMYKEDVGEWKAFALAANLLPHAMRPIRITAIALPFEKALAERETLAAIINEPIIQPNLMIVVVDNDACRLEAIRYARLRSIPIIFSMMSYDGMRLISFLQGSDQTDACLHCALPQLNSSKPPVSCAPSIIYSCFRAAAQTLFFVHQALMGWPSTAKQYNFYEADFLSTSQPASTGFVRQRTDCPTCSPFQIASN